MELSTPALVTDGVGKISSSLRSPVGPSQESLCLSVSVPLLSSLPLFFSQSYLAHSSLLVLLVFSALIQWSGRVKSVRLHAPPVFLFKRERRMTSVG